MATAAASSPASASGQCATPNGRVLASRDWSAARSASPNASFGKRRQSSCVRAAGSAAAGGMKVDLGSP